MDFIEKIIRHLSPSQLRALFFLAKNKNGIISSTGSAKEIGKEGKALGGVFSSLARKKINGQYFIIPWGKDASGRGLKWKLNEKLITKDKLLKITKELLV